MHTVMGGKVAPAAAAKAKTTNAGAFHFDRGHQGDERCWKGNAARRKGAHRTPPVDQPSEKRRDDRESYDIAGRRRAAAGERPGRRMHQKQNRESGDANRQPPQHGCGNGLPHFARLQQRAVACE